MNKKTIIKVLFFLSILLIFLLILISQKQSITKTPLEELNNLSINQESKEILTSGTISQINYNPSYQTIYLENCTTPFIIITNKILNIKQGQLVEITGKLEIYKNHPKILVDKIAL